MSAADLLALSSALPLGTVVTILNETLKSVEAVKVHKQRCKDLGSRCVRLLVALNDSSEGLEGTTEIQWLDELTETIRKVDQQVSKWAQMNAFKSHFNKTDIREGIDSLYKEIESSHVQFSIKMGSYMARRLSHILAVQERDHAITQDTIINHRDKAEITDAGGSTQIKTRIHTGPDRSDAVIQKANSTSDIELERPKLAAENKTTLQKGLPDPCSRIQRRPTTSTMSQKGSHRHVVESSRSLSGRRMADFSKIQPHDFAVALTLVEGDAFRLISAAHYVVHLQYPDANRTPISQLIHTSKKISMLVKRSILESLQIQSRAKIFKFFVKAAQECLTLKNFASMSAIITALKSAEIASLKLTMQEVSKFKCMQQLVSLWELISPVHDHMAYKEALPLTGSAICVPWANVHLDKLRWAFYRCPLSIIQGQSPVDSTSFIEFYRELGDILRFVVPDLDMHRGEDALALLKAELQYVRVDPSDDDYVKQLGANLQEKENQNYVTRQLELEKTGFR